MENGYVLGTSEIQELISMLTPGEVRDAQIRLGVFLRDYSIIGLERMVILAYLLGEKDGLCASGTFSADILAGRLKQIYDMGKTHGFTEAAMLFNSPKKRSASEGVSSDPETRC